MTSKRVFFSVQEVAAKVGLHEKTIRRSIHRGELQAVRLCGQLRISRDAFSAWCEAGTMVPAVMPARGMSAKASHRVKPGATARHYRLRPRVAASCTTATNEGGAE